MRFKEAPGGEDVFFRYLLLFSCVMSLLFLDCVFGSRDEGKCWNLVASQNPIRLGISERTGFFGALRCVAMFFLGNLRMAEEKVFH
jgi:hypothetical protein